MELKNAVPWGRSLDEYQAMFDLSPEDLGKKMLGCGDGPASFNAQINRRGGRVVSCDPLYEFSSEQINKLIEAAKEEIMPQLYKDRDKYVWKTIKSPDELLRKRMTTMHEFMEDFETGKKQGRYKAGSLPALPFKEKEFDIALCSHFLFLYSNTGLEFHLAAVREMLRVSRQIRIFPLYDLNGKKSAWLDPVIQKLKDEDFSVEIVKVHYELQLGANEMLKVGDR